jgi:16S rRNA (cytidine1402-2'-O)-methyltransferase
MAGTLYAIPTPLGGTAADALPASVLKTVKTLRYFVVENAKTARAFLKDVGMPCAMQDLEISVLEADVSGHVRRLKAGHSAGLLSEAGCPAIADPGAALVEAAQREGIRVVPLIGPSSIVLALMASGLEGQRFAFCGYLPREAEERRKKIKEIESRSRRERETQIFIETPYRNDVMLGALLEVCAPETLVCVASDLTLPAEQISARKISDWRRARLIIGKRPTVFLLLSVNRQTGARGKFEQ